MYLNIYNYTKSLFGRNIEIFNDETKWGYISWESHFSTNAIGDLYGKKYQLKVSSYIPLQVKINNPEGSQEVATLKFNLWCTRGKLTTVDKSEFQLKSIHHFQSKYSWLSNGTEVMRIKNEIKGGTIESSVTDEEHNAILVVSALYINNHLTSSIILILILLFLIFE